jgi:hypothetical protein
MTIVKNAFLDYKCIKKPHQLAGFFVEGFIIYTRPCAIIALATLINPATFAPLT